MTVLRKRPPHLIELLVSGLNFLLVFLALQYVYFGGEQSEWRRTFIDRITLGPVVGLIDLVAPGEEVVGAEGSMVAPGIRLSLRTGCDGADAMILLVSAFAAAGLGWRRTLAGMAGGILLIYLLNQARIVALYFSFRYSREWFDLLHGVIGPVLIVAAAALYFFWCLERMAHAKQIAGR